MIERAFVQVGGPPGSGKTTFIEAMLAGAGTLTLAARCLRDDTLAQARESAPRTHPELRRYRQAGAADTALYTFPGQQSGTDDFFMTNLMTDYSQAVVLEGDSPLDYVDLRVFVAPAPARTEQLFVRRTRRRSPDEAAGGPALRHLLSEPGDLAEALARIGAEPLAEFARNNPALVDKIRAVLGEVIAEPASASPRGSEKRWSVADAYAGIEHAGLVVVNCRHGGNRRPPKLSSPTWSASARTKSLLPTSWAPEATGYLSRWWWPTWPIRVTPGARRPSLGLGGRLVPDRRSTPRVLLAPSRARSSVMAPPPAGADVSRNVRCSGEVEGAPKRLSFRRCAWWSSCRWR